MLKHKIKTGQCHCLIIFANVGWKCAALSWASIIAILFLLCNQIFLMSPLHDLLIIIRWHLIRNNSALWKDSAGWVRVQLFLKGDSKRTSLFFLFQKMFFGIWGLTFSIGFRKRSCYRVSHLFKHLSLFSGPTDLDCTSRRHLEN